MMKKTLFFAAILFAAVGCSEAAISEDTFDLGSDDSSSSNDLIHITIGASMSASNDSRVSVTPGEADQAWSVDWDSDDELILVDTESPYAEYAISVKEIDLESGCATFEGDVTTGVYNVYLLDNYKVNSDGTVTVDYSAQSDDCSNLPMCLDGTLTVSDDFEFAELSLEHMAQAVDIRVSFTGLGDSDYTLKSVTLEESNDYGFDKVKVTTSKELSASAASCNLYCYLPAFSVAASESITATAVITDTQGDDYTVTCQITNSTDGTLDFNAGAHNYLTAAFDYADAALPLWSDYAATSFAGDVEYSSSIKSYDIESAEQLAYLATLVNAGKSMSGVTFTQTQNIDLSGKEWVAIGTSDDDFAGVFDGDNLNISGLYIDTTSDYQGLFGYIWYTAAVVKNVNIANGSVSAGSNVGGVVGRAHFKAQVSNCSNSADITGVSYVGGVVGYSYLSITSNCTNYGSVEGTASSSTYAGGVVGYSNGHSTTSYAGSFYIEDCINEGDVSGGAYVGGIAGRVNYVHPVSRCMNKGSISATYSVGGIIGYADYTVYIDACYNADGAVINGSYNVGGIVGYITSASSTTSTISNCYNNGSITYFGTSSSGSFGGIAGFGSGSAEVSNCYNTADIAGYTYVGGVVGYIYSGSATNCYSSGLPSVGTGSYVGGITGYLGSSAKVTTCIYDSSVFTRTSIDGVTGQSDLTAEMTGGSFAATLGDSFKEDSAGVNGGYPILTWQ